MIPPFSFARIPHIIFGAGKLNKLYNTIIKYGRKVLLVIGGESLRQSGKWYEIKSSLKENSIDFSLITIPSEPSSSLIDSSILKLKNQKFDVVIGIGGGSVIDAGKAISAMITKDDSITNYLEGIGNKSHDGEKIPYIAIPTTSGTGSEATKNAVISQIGPDGYKKSLRHDNLIPNLAIIDPELMISCPSSITASCGMDAFTQLLEAFVSTKSNPITNILAMNGMKYMSKNIVLASTSGSSNIEVRAAMAYGALMSGITLANAGLGVIHGLASSIGGFFEIPHGVVCGTLLAETTKMNINGLREESTAQEALNKYAEVGRMMLGDRSFDNEDIDEYCNILIKTLETWTSNLKIEKLRKYGITEEDIEKIVEKTGLKNNPVNLSKEIIGEIIINRL
jgi:alcohol dehydrogenase class IV